MANSSHSGRSCGGGASSMGTSFGWGSDPVPISNSITGQNRAARPSSNASYAQSHAVPVSNGSLVLDLAPGAIVMYSMKPGHDEEEALVLEVSSDSHNAQGRRDNVRIQFHDGRERQTSEGRLRVVRAPAGQPAPTPYSHADENRAPEQYGAGGPEPYLAYGQAPQANYSAGPPAQQYQQQQYGGSPQKQMPPQQQYQQEPQQEYQQQYQVPPQQYQQQQKQFQAPQQQYNPPSPERHSSGFGDTGKSCVRISHQPGGNNSMGSSFGWGNDQPSTPKRGDFHENRIGTGVSPNQNHSSPSRKNDFHENRIGAGVEAQNLQPVKGAGTGELAVGQVVVYKQTPRSEDALCTVIDVELPSTNGAMRTKTYYNVRFEDGRTRQTTIDKLSVPKNNYI